MDPLHTIVRKKDTTFILMLEAHARGNNVYFLPSGGITFKKGKLFFSVTKVTPQKNNAQPFIKHSTTTLSQDEVSILFIRTDPPFNGEYLANTWLLDLLAETIPVINNPKGIRNVNEKIWASQFKNLTPNTIISRDKTALLEFITEEKEVIAKPINGHGGKSIFYITKNETNTNVILETLTNLWQTHIVLQQFIPEAKNGDKRILLLNGEPIGALLRVHSKNDHRNNIFAGGKTKPVKINRRDIEIIEKIKPALKKEKLYFVGIDIIGEYLIEINVTSPTCVQEISQFNTKLPGLEKEIISFAEQLILERNS